LVAAHTVGDREQITALRGIESAREWWEFADVDGVFVLWPASDVGGRPDDDSEGLLRFR
jgi:hypothetical protein